MRSVLGRKLGRQRRGSRTSEAGFGLVDVAVAMALFALMMTALAALVSTTLATTRTNRQRTVAANLAAREMDLVRSTRFEDLPLGRTTSIVRVDRVNYTVTRDAQWVYRDAADSPCGGAGGSTLAYLRMTVSVTWPNMRGVAPVSSSTIVAPPITSYDPSSGHIAVTVRDRSGAPHAGILTRVTGPSGTSTQTTTADGCAFFAFLPAGIHTVSLGNLGYVDGQAVADPSQVVSVNVGTSVGVEFDYDRAATLSLTLGGFAGGTIPANLPVTFANTKLLPAGTKTIAGQFDQFGRPMGVLFPYADGYQTWAGSCADADPEGQRADGSGPYYPGAVRAPALPASAGQVTPGTVTLRTVRVRVATLLGLLPVKNAKVFMRHGPDNGCPGGLVLDLGKTSATGEILAAVPYGAWTFEVENRVPSGGWPAPVVAPPASAGIVTVDVRVL